MSKIFKITFIFISIFIYICFLYYNYTNKEESIIVIGHRASKQGVENTVEAVIGAIHENADYVEIDVQLSKDGIPIAFHDTNLLRLSGENINIYDHTLEELKSFELTQNNYYSTIQTLDEICKTVNGKIDILIDYKVHGKEKDSLVDKVVEVINNNKMESNVIFQTSKYFLIEEMKSKYPDFEIGYILSEETEDVSDKVLEDINIDFFVLRYNIINPKIVLKIQRLNKKVFVWTVNNSDRIKEFIKIGVNGIITDYPSEVKQIILSNQ